MKLNKLLLIALCITYFSCTTETAGNPPEEETTDSTLIKKIVYNKGTADEYTETFNYDGNKLTSVDDGDGYKNVYTYEDDKLVKEDAYIDGNLVAYATLEYNSEGILVEFTEYWFDTNGLPYRAYKNILTYNSDNTITRESYLGDHNSQTDLNFTDIISFEGKNISKNYQNSSDYKILYTYDDKNGMYKNIHAIEVLNILSENEFGAAIYGNTNNITSYTESDTNINNVETLEYIYNENGYPISAISSFPGEPVETLDFIY